MNAFLFALIVLASAALLAALPTVGFGLPLPAPVYATASRRGMHPVVYAARRVNYDETLKRASRLVHLTGGLGASTEPEPPAQPAKRPLKIVFIDDSEGFKLYAQYVDFRGRRIKNDKGDTVREFTRCPAKVFGLLDDKDVLILDLNEKDKDGHVKELPPKGTLFKVRYDGREYVLDFSASSAKDRRVPLVAVEKKLASRYFQFAEQSVYGQRMFLTSARRAVRGSFTVGIKPEGFVLPNGDVVGDGCGYISETFWSQLIGNPSLLKMTELQKKPKDSFQLYRMPWKSIKKEAIPLLQKSMDDILEHTENFFRATLAGYEEKMALLTADEEMINHPICANAFMRESRLSVAARSYSVPFENSHYKLAMPVIMPEGAGKVAFQKGNWVLGRYPFSSNAAIRSYVIGDEGEKVYYERVAERIGCQYSMTALTDKDPVHFGAKGMLIVVPDDVIEGFDVVICSKDIKMGAINGQQSKSGVSKRDRIEVVDGYLGAIQIYGPGAFFGVDIEEWTGFPGDFDGDGGVLYECSNFMSFWQAVKDLPRKPNFKAFNSETPYSDKNVSIKAWQVMNSYIGQLSNIMSSTFVMEDREMFAKQMGFKSAEAMDDRIAWLMQVEVDRFKKNTASALSSDMKQFKSNDPDFVMGKVVQILERNVIQVLSRVAPWTGWKRNEDVFRFFVPGVYRKGMPKNEEAESISDFWDGAVAEMLKFTLPRMQEKLQLAATVRPLGYFYNWARPVSPDLEKVAKAIVERFARELISLNQTSEGAMDEFKETWKENMQKWMEATQLLASVLCAALWRASHSQSAQFSSAVCPFWCFPDEAFKIVSEKPGLEKITRAKVIGLNKRIPTNGGPDILVDIRVKIEDIKLVETVGTEQRKRLARVVRAAEGPELPLNNENHDRVGYPMDFLAEVPFDAVVYPPEGKYIADFARVSKGAWTMELKKQL